MTNYSSDFSRLANFSHFLKIQTFFLSSRKNKLFSQVNGMIYVDKINFLSFENKLPFHKTRREIHWDLKSHLLSRETVMC